MGVIERERTSFGQRLFDAREAVGLNQTEVCKRIGISQGTLSGLERTAHASRHTAVLAKLYGVDANYLATGEPTPNAGGGKQVAHTLSLSAFDDPPTLTWEKIMEMEKLPPQFRCAVPDDATAPEFPRGLELVWSTAKGPRVGSLVIVRDKHGVLHVRQYRQGKAPGQWIAAATNSAFADFSSDDDGPVVVAVAQWRPMP